MYWFAFVFLVGLSICHGSPQGEFCAPCKIIIGATETYIGENATEAKIVDFLDNDVCPLIVNLVPVQVCKEFVSLYIKYIVNAVLTEENPTRVCIDLGLCTNTSVANGYYGYFWQVTDMHIDPQYQAGTDPKMRCIKGKPDNGKGAGVIGDYLCDLAPSTVEQVMQFMVKMNPSPNFIIWTGDAPPHYLDFTSMENYTAAMVLQNIEGMTQMITKYFPNVPVFPSLGNHDNFPADELPPPPEGSKWLTKIGQIWKNWLSSDALKTFSFGGYYTSLAETGLRIIALNTPYCDPFNTWALLGNNDIAGQFQWLNTVLQQARKNQEMVYIIGHIPPGKSTAGNHHNFAIGIDDTNGIAQSLPHCDDYYLQLYEEYSDIIANNFRVVKDKATNSKLLSSIFVVPSMTTFQNHNPSVRIYQYDLTSKLLNNYYQYYSNITNDNITGKVNFAYAYDWKGAYHQPDLSPESFMNVLTQIQTNETMWNLYEKFYNNLAMPISCDGSCKKTRLCAMGNIDLGWYTKCMLS